MTLAVAAPTPTQLTVPQTVPIVILGTDALLAALPATPVQLAHACLRAGFANVIPASWGDEIIAAAVLRRLPRFGNGPAIQCSCPIVAHRLLTAGGDLRPVMLPLVPPPVAISRYVRTLSLPTRTRITYVGNCPGAVDESIDIRMTPDALIAMLAERQISLDDQPRIFEAVIPPDRRRFRSQPGGVPATDVLWSESGSRTLIEIDGDDFAADIAQHLLTGKNVLIDASARLGCVCSGAQIGTPAREARAHVVALEPPRATIPVVDEQAPIELDRPVPAASRTPIDLAAGPPTPTSMPLVTPPRGSEASTTQRSSPPRGFSQVPDSRPTRSASPPTPRPVVGSVPVARDAEGRSLPRAYVARRRSAPRGMPAIRMPVDQTPTSTPVVEPAPVIAGPIAPAPVAPALVAPAPVIPEPPVLAAPPVVTAPTVTAPVQDVNERIRERIDERVEARRNESIERVEQRIEEPLEERYDRVEDTYQQEASALAEAPMVAAPPVAPVGLTVSRPYIVLLVVVIVAMIFMFSAAAFVVGRSFNSPATPSATR